MIVGATNAPVLTTAAFRMKSRRPLVPPVAGRSASSPKLAIGPASQVAHRRLSCLPRNRQTMHYRYGRDTSPPTPNRDE
jgi:hypothetical protein